MTVLNTPDRASIVVIVANDFMHFTSGPIQRSSEGTDLWFPLVGRSVFEAVEKVMQIHQIAHHCVDIEVVRTSGQAKDYRITYSPKRTAA